MNVKINAKVVEDAFSRKLRYYVERIKAQGGVHDGHGGSDFMPHYLILLASGDVCPIFKGTYQCTNPLYTKRDDGVWLSPGSVSGPNIDWRDRNMTIDEVIDKAHREYKTAIEEYGTPPVVGWIEVQ